MSNELFRKTYRVVKIFRNYNGVCHNCNSPINYSGEFAAVEIEERRDCFRVDLFSCPHCKETVTVIRIYKNLEVSKELAEL